MAVMIWMIIQSMKYALWLKSF